MAVFWSVGVEMVLIVSFYHLALERMGGVYCAVIRCRRVGYGCGKNTRRIKEEMLCGIFCRLGKILAWDAGGYAITVQQSCQREPQWLNGNPTKR